MVAVFQTDTEEFTIVGTLPDAKEGRCLKLKGEFIVHPKFGEQFSFSSFEESMPTTKLGMVTFLSSGVLKGVGSKKAEAIVNAFGQDTFRIIEEEPDRLVEVSGIGPKTANTIHEAYKQHKAFADVSMFLADFGIGGSFAMKLFKVFGEDTIKEVKSNPYNMVDEVFGIGFKQADSLALSMGIEKNNEARISCGVIYILQRYAGRGHSFCSKDVLCQEAGQLLEVSMEEISDSIVNMAFEGKVHVDKIQGLEVCYLYAYYLAEQSVCGKLALMVESQVKPLNVKVDNLINVTESKLGIGFSEEQKVGIKRSVNSGVSVITGGPGTGKTTLINGILTVLTEGGLNVAAVAPTGRAAKRINEATGFEASTIHRLLEYHFDEDQGRMVFGKNEDEPLEYDAIICDEASMIDILLMDGLLKAVSSGSRLIIVGDMDQLPSVGVGNVLRDIIESEYVMAIRLTEIFRQAKESMIVVNAHRINKGEMPYLNEKDTDFFFVKGDNMTNLADTITDLCVRRLPGYFEFADPVRDIQVLTPRRKGKLGSEGLNPKLQAVLNPPHMDLEEKEIGNRIFREGDKVMQIKNNYDLEWICQSDFTKGEGVFNGDMGYIHKIDKDFNKIIVIFDGDRFVNYEFDQLDQLEHAYAVTVHKSQGSEFPIIVMPVTWNPEVLATRNLLYTAVTRGKAAVVLVGSVEMMEAMVNNNKIVTRNSGLKYRIKKIMEENKGENS